MEEGVDVSGLNLPKNIMVNKQLRNQCNSEEYERNLRNYQKQLPRIDHLLPFNCSINAENTAQILNQAIPNRKMQIRNPLIRRTLEDKSQAA